MKNVTTFWPKLTLTLCCATCHQTLSNLHASQMQITCTTKSRTTPWHSSTTVFQVEHGFNKTFPWIAAATSNQIESLNTQQIKVATRPTTYRKKKLRALEAEVLKNCEADRIAYQEKVFGTKKSSEIFRHLKFINKEPRIPKTVKYKKESASIT